MRHRKDGRRRSAVAAEKFSNILGTKAAQPEEYEGNKTPGDWHICVILNTWLSLAKVSVNIRNLQTIEHGLVLLRETRNLRGSV